jgi:hypothetical protein
VLVKHVPEKLGYLLVTAIFPARCKFPNTVKLCQEADRFRPVPPEGGFFLAFPTPLDLLEGFRLETFAALLELMGQAKRS